jgi:transcriptional regulator with PAS, ATPase and Fis domain
MMNQEWIDTLDAAITICDKKGIIKYMNEKAMAGFSKYGGRNLLGSNLLDCHSESSKEILKEMFVKASERIYTTEKEGIKKLICQKPIFEKGKFAGIIEMVIILPSKMPHYLRN